MYEFKMQFLFFILLVWMIVLKTKTRIIKYVENRINPTLVESKNVEI